MLARWPIRNKLLVGLVLLLSIFGTLSGIGLMGLYAYRDLVKSLNRRAAELPLATAVGQQVSNLRLTLSDLRALRELSESSGGTPAVSVQILRDDFRRRLAEVGQSIEHYRVQIEQNELWGNLIGDSQRERETIQRLEELLTHVRENDRDEDWIFGTRLATLEVQLEQLQRAADTLPESMHASISQFTADVRNEYRTLIIVFWFTCLLAAATFALFVLLSYRWIFRPLRMLIKGSRKVAGGDFHYRIRLDAHDEMAELAEAMNDMTERFQTIRDDLDHQVQVRTRQVVRSEQLASVGFLAAGVAHEINNPLASIAMCAESLEGRLSAGLEAAPEDRSVVAQYLRMIQTEAFRCKEITEKLLDFARLGEVTRQATDLGELARGVIDMVRHLGKYQDRHVELSVDEPLLAPVNPQEMKQVLLNLLTNALDSLEPGGRVAVALSRRGGRAEIVVADDGCGMTPEVLEHLFEPFFTRRRSGQGTGLGLSITYRIVTDHEGTIEAESAGPGCGSRFRISLPLGSASQETYHRYQAA